MLQWKSRIYVPHQTCNKHVTLAAIIVTIERVPYQFVKSQQLVWRTGTVDVTYARPIVKIVVMTLQVLQA